MRTITKSLISGMLAAGFALLPVFGFAADENDIIRLEKELIQKETDLLTPELDLDKYLVERAKLDGMGGLFQGSKKKALDQKIEASQGQIDRIYSDMKSLQGQIQEMVYQVATTFEKQGDYQKAINYYLKVNNQTDAVKLRIASCFKALADYQSAIQWFLKMARTDANLLNVVECYRLDGRMKESLHWLFEILEPLDGNAAEMTAFQLIEAEYPGKKVDYPDFNQRLSDIYIRYALLNYQKDFSLAKQAYHKAITLLAENKDPRDVSFEMVVRHQSALQGALDMLQQQREAAERNYESMLRDARYDLERAEDRLRREMREAEIQYQTALDQARRDLDRAERELEKMEKQASPSVELIQQAKNQVQRARQQYSYVSQNRQQIIEDHVRPYRHAVRETRDKYQHIMDSRFQIIEDYIRPYKARVDEAKRMLDLIRTLHDAAFGRN